MVLVIFAKMDGKPSSTNSFLILKKIKKKSFPRKKYNLQYFASFKALLIVGKARFLWSEYRDEKLFLVFDVFPLRLQDVTYIFSKLSMGPLISLSSHNPILSLEARSTSWTCRSLHALQSQMTSSKCSLFSGIGTREKSMSGVNRRCLWPWYYFISTSVHRKTERFCASCWEISYNREWWLKVTNHKTFRLVLNRIDKCTPCLRTMYSHHLKRLLF